MHPCDSIAKLGECVAEACFCAGMYCKLFPSFRGNRRKVCKHLFRANYTGLQKGVTVSCFLMNIY